MTPRSVYMLQNGKHPSAWEFLADLAAQNECISRVHSHISGFSGCLLNCVSAQCDCAACLR